MDLICISCMGTNKLLNLFEKRLYENEYEDCSVLLKECFDITISQKDGNFKICEPCTHTLRAAHTFKIQTLTTHTILMSTKGVKLKIIQSNKRNLHKSTLGEHSPNDTENVMSELNQMKIMNGSIQDDVVFVPGSDEDDESIIDGDDILVMDNSDEELDEAYTFLDPNTGVLVKKPLNDEIHTDDFVSSPNNDDFLENAKLRNNVQSNETITKMFNIKSNQRTCAICKKEFLNTKSLLEHMHCHNPKQVCETCGKSFADKRSFYRHKKCHEDGEFKCKYCDRIFKKSNTLNCHIWRSHSNAEPYVCHLCKSRFRTEHRRMKHIRIDHGDNTKRYKCEKCDSWFYDSGSRSKHMTTHIDVKIKHKCHMCPMKLANRTLLKKHLACIHGVGERNFACSRCPKAFYDRTSLIAHMVVHEKTNKFACDYCKSTFNYKSILKNHIKKHEELGVKMQLLGDVATTVGERSDQWTGDVILVKPLTCVTSDQKQFDLKSETDV